MAWEHYKTVDPLKREPQIGRGLFPCLVSVFKLQFSKSIKFSTFPIFLNLTSPLRKNISFPKMLKNHPKIYTNPQNIALCSSCLNRAGRHDIGTKAMLSDVKTAFR